MRPPSAPFLLLLLAVALPAPAKLAAVPPVPKNRPNIIFYLSDDLGYGEVNQNSTFYGFAADARTGLPVQRPVGAPLRTLYTPNLERLASQGTRYWNSLAPSVECAPSRVAFMLGRSAGTTPIRGDSTMGNGLNPDVTDTMLSEVLNDAGYMTAAIGKWGMGSNGGAPWNHGFDFFAGQLEQIEAWTCFPTSIEMFTRTPFSTTVPPATPSYNLNQDMWLGALSEQRCAIQQRNCTYTNSLFRNLSLSYIEQFIYPMSKDYTRPFFLYWAPTTPHVGSYSASGILTSPVDNMNCPSCAGQPTMCRRGHASQIETGVDQDIGSLLDLLQSAPSLDANTIVIFASDNGPHGECADDSNFSPAYFIGSGGLRGMKRTMYEGGPRSPTMVRWPGVVAAGAWSNVPHTLVDVAVTLIALTGAKPLPTTGARGAPGGGVSLVDLWKKGTVPSRTVPIIIQWCANNMPAQCATSLYSTVNWPNSLPKLIHNVDGSFELYELVSDPAETTNLASTSATLVQKLYKEMLASTEPLCQVAQVFQSPLCARSVFPTSSPTTQPTARPTRMPTFAPTSKPSRSPVHSPTRSPTTSLPTFAPTLFPTQGVSPCDAYDTSLVGSPLPIRLSTTIGSQNRFHADGCPMQSSNFGWHEPEFVALFEAPSSGPYIFDTIQSQFDTILYVVNCSSRQQIACDDDGYGQYGLLSLVGPLQLNKGDRLAVITDAYGTAPLSSNSVVQLNIRQGLTEYEVE